MNILVTGAAGFIGHHLCHVLLAAGHRVVGLDRIDHTSTLDRLRGVRNTDHFKFVWHDLKSPINSLVSSLIGDVQAVFHLAASTHVERSIKNSLPFVLDNVVGTTHLLEYARSLSDLRLFLNFSTDEVFGSASSGIAYKENDAYHPKNPYSSTKAAAVEIAHSYANTYGIPVLTTHCMNVFGERQHPEKFVPLIIQKVLQRQPVEIHATPDLKSIGARFYIYAPKVAGIVSKILDAVEAGLLQTNTKLNIPGDREVDNLELARFVADCCGQKLHYQLIDFHSSRPGHDLRYALDATAICDAGLLPPPSLEKDIEATVSWYLKHKEWLLL